MKLGLVGFSRAGKDEAAKALLDGNWHRIGFADALKRDCMKMLAAVGVDVDLIGDGAAKELWRPLLVAVGAGMRRKQPDHWIRRAIVTMANKRLGYQDNVVITDVRYLNEANWILRHEGALVYIERPGYAAVNDEEARSIAELLADPAVQARMVRIVNDGTIAELHTKIRAAVKLLRQPRMHILNRLKRMYGDTWFSTRKAVLDLHESHETVSRALQNAYREDRVEKREGKACREEWRVA